jgi:hypothetical protein
MFGGVRVTRSLVFCVVFYRSLFVLFLLFIVLSVLRITDCDYPIGIFKLSEIIRVCLQCQQKRSEIIRVCLQCQQKRSEILV